MELLLSNYREIKDAELTSDLAEYKIDLERALEILLPEERKLLEELYFVDPAAPRRTGKVGRPSGGTTQSNVARKMANTNYSDTAKRAEVTRRKQAILVKLSNYLGYDNVP